MNSRQQNLWNVVAIYAMSKISHQIGKLFPNDVSEIFTGLRSWCGEEGESGEAGKETNSLQRLRNSKRMTLPKCTSKDP